jgi:sigma-B regulation protein RsbU (phosphoserine phosphatase)
MSGFVIAAYFLFVVGIGKLVLNLTGSTSQIVTILATLFIAAVFNPVKNKIQIFVDRRFLPDRFRYREAVREFRHQLVNVVDLKKLNDLLLHFLSEKMQIHSVAVLWNIDNNGEYTITDTKGIDTGFDTRFNDADIVIERLQKKQGLIDVSPLKTKSNLMSPDERARWEVLRTELVLPLLTKGKLNGLISLGIKKAQEPYYKEDLDLLETLGDQINISLENALLTEELREQDRLRKELEVARRIQLSSLPQDDPDIPGLDVSGISIPALEVGGDYYDYLSFADDRFGVVVGDVSGKGTSAALYMSQLKGILHTASNYHHTLKGLICEVNSVTFRNIEQKSFITLTCAAFDIKKQRLCLIRAGHLPIIHYSAGENRCTELQPGGIGIGLEKGLIFEKELEECHRKYESGDVFLFYTDGIVEAKSTRRGDFDMNLVEEILAQSTTQSAVWLRQKIIAKVNQFADDTNQKDDMTLVVVKVP